MTDENPKESRPRLFGLIKAVPDLVTRLIRDEVASAKAEIGAKIKAAGLGAGLAVAGAVFALFALGWMLAAAVSGLEFVVARWLAELIVAGAVLIVAAILISVGVGKLKAGVPPEPTETIDSAKRDIRAVTRGED